MTSRSLFGVRKIGAILTLFKVPVIRSGILSVFHERRSRSAIWHFWGILLENCFERLRSVFHETLKNTNFRRPNEHTIFVAVFARDLEVEFFMESDQTPIYHPVKRTKTRKSAKNKRKAVPLKQSRLSSELEALRLVSQQTFSSGNRMAVHRFLGAIFNLVSVWEAEDRLEEGLYRLLDFLKAPVPLRIGEAFAVAIYCTAPHVDKKSRSKWARALRFAAANKPDDELIKNFFKRKGGINACASKHAEYVRRPGGD